MAHALKSYRAEKGLTQEALAKDLGVHPFTLSRWETGMRKIDKSKLAAISQITGIPARELRPDLAALLGAAE